MWPLPLVLVLVGVTIMSFPDGRLPSADWRPVVAAMTVVATALAVLSALWPLEYAENGLSVAHPLDVGGVDGARRAWSALGPPAYLSFQLAWVVCVVGRWRRARADEAYQLKWFAYAVAVSGVAMVVGLVTFGSATVGVLAASVVPVAAGAAILRYRLYDIDPVINRTLVVGAMAALVTAVYVAVVVGAGGLLGLAAEPHVGLSLVATAVIAVAFEPVRRRVQRAVDRLVYGDRPTPYETLARLPTRLRHAAGEPDEVFAELASAVADGVGAVEVTLWVGDRELVAVATWPPADGPGPGDRRPLPATPTDLDSLGGQDRTHVRPLVHQGRRRGAVTLTKAPGEDLTATDHRLLDDLAAQAGLVIDHAGLGAELRDRLHQIAVQAAELQAAAKRIVAAQDEARRRIERDLHDGAQQRLVTLALHLSGLADRAAGAGDTGLAAEVAAARAELLTALGELREMARGIHPTVLTEDGLEAAVEALAERSTLPVEVDLRLDRKLTQEVEAAAYFVVGEALTNAAKHAGASQVTVAGRVVDGRLVVEVTDDGCGGAVGSEAGGLQGLTDRLATLDGALTITSPPGEGTRLRAEIPCG